ncbi:MAG: cation diffusion facilitator family transporter [Actinobacteria bacterium]|nr:cation diffusion facilitator family transporter [Actinomycetota bacterium]
MEHDHPPKRLTLSGQTDKKLPHALREHENHSHENHRHDFRPYERKKLLITIILTGIMMIVEILGGIFTGSLALISDAGHMLTHAFALLVSFLAILYACRPATKDKSFGFYRAEILAALLNGITLLIITGFILWEAYKRILNPRPIAGMEMMIIGIIGLLVNIVTALLLWKASRESLNIRSAFIHMLGDTGSSIGVVIGAIIIYFTGFYIIDPILSIIIAILIAVWSISLIRDSVLILMESTPKNINVVELKAGVISQNGNVIDIHDLHVWEITSNMYCMTAHIVIEDMNVSQTQQLLDEINQYLFEKYNIQHPIIQFETGGGFDHEYGCNPDKRL